MHKDKTKAYLAWISVCIVWGTTYLAIRIGVHDLPPMLFAGLRWILAGAILFIFLWIRNYNRPNLNEIIHSGIIGILLLGFGNGLVVFAEQWIPSGLAALIITTVPLWLVLFESLIPQGSKLNLETILGILLGLVGIILIFSSDIDEFLNTQNFLVIIAIIFAVINWALGTLYSKYRRLNIHPLMSASVQMMIAGSLQVILGLILGEISDIHLSNEGILAFFYLIIFGSLFGYAAYIYAISYLPISLVSTYAYVNPVIALFLGWLILDETINSIIMISTILIFISVTIIKRGADKKQV